MVIVSEDESQKILEKIEMIKTDSGGSVANTISQSRYLDWNQASGKAE